MPVAVRVCKANYRNSNVISWKGSFKEAFFLPWNTSTGIVCTRMDMKEIAYVHSLAFLHDGRTVLRMLSMSRAVEWLEVADNDGASYRRSPDSFATNQRLPVCESVVSALLWWYLLSLCTFMCV